uniref:Uncharacterized protein n=1 Tax=Romanomermis culicivorax TaxID=13658 RepID=A0A915KW66_ROMCU
MESSKVGCIDEKVITGNEMSEFVFLWSESVRTKDYCFIRTLPGLGDMNLQGRIDDTKSNFLYEDPDGSIYESDMWHIPDSQESMLW